MKRSDYRVRGVVGGGVARELGRFDNLLEALSFMIETGDSLPAQEWDALELWRDGEMVDARYKAL